MTGAVYRLGASHVEDAAALMARAFFDYPMWQWVMPDEEHRRRALLVSARSSVLWGQILGETFALGATRMQGVAIWAPPGMADADVDPDGLRTNWSQVLDVVGPDGMRRFEAMIEVQRPLREKYIQKGWYLAWLGVDPAAQRTGVGSTLLRHMLDQRDVEGVPTFLETEKAANVPYYLKHGYGIVHSGVLPDNGPEFWCFLRTPLPAPR